MLRFLFCAPIFFAAMAPQQPSPALAPVPSDPLELATGATVLQAQVEGISEASGANRNLFIPTPGMHSPGPVISAPIGFEQFLPGGGGAAASVIHPVIVVAEVDANGKTLEAEPLQTSDATDTAAALQFVRSNNFGPAEADGGAPLQRQIFVNVQFRGGGE